MGTVTAGGYQRMCERYGMSCITPDKTTQAQLMHLIYDQVKSGLPADAALFEQIGRRMLAAGCDALIIGCTELSLIRRNAELPYVDSMEILAACCITACGKGLRNMPDSIVDFTKNEDLYHVYAAV